MDFRHNHQHHVWRKTKRSAFDEKNNFPTYKNGGGSIQSLESPAQRHCKIVKLQMEEWIPVNISEFWKQEYDTASQEPEGEKRVASTTGY